MVTSRPWMSWLFCFSTAIGSSAFASAGMEPGSGYPFDVPRIRPTSEIRQARTHFPITGLDDAAQSHVDAAVEVMHGFWLYEAERDLREVLRRYPEHPLVLALAAFAQTIFNSGDMERGRLYFDQASALWPAWRAQASAREQRWFAVIETLYDPKLTSDVLRQQAHIHQLEQLTAAHPDDLEAKAFLALAYWLFRLNPNKASPDEQALLRARADLLIDDVLRETPDHPVHHYKIHLWNNERDDYMALASARKSGPAQSHIAHLWHMPAHILTTTGDFTYALRHVQVAHRVDHRQMAERRLMPAMVHNYYHNYRDYALPLASGAGQIDEVTARIKMMLRGGRLPTLVSRRAHATIATKLCSQLENYDAWDEFDTLLAQGYFDRLDNTGDVAIDRKFKSRVLRMRIRSLTATSERFARGRQLVPVLLRELERLKAEATVAGKHDPSLVAAHDDSLFWYEIAIRRESDHIPFGFLERMITIAETPRGRLLQLLYKAGYVQRAAALAETLYGELPKLPLHELAALLDFEKSFAEAAQGPMDPRVAVRIAAIEKQALRTIVPPIDLRALHGLDLASKRPDVLESLVARATSWHRERLSNPPEEFRYITELALDAMGPVDPERIGFPPYEGEEAALVAAFATPQSGKAKAFIFGIGPICSACADQVAKFREVKAELARAGIELIVVTQSAEGYDGMQSIADTDHTLHRQFTMWDAFTEQPLHGVVLINGKREILWDSVTSHAIEDVAFLKEEMLRVLRLDRVQE